jgi:hypothetical protein
MSAIAGWRIQVRPQYCEPDLTASEFINVRIADRDDAIAAVRNREDADPGEQVYAVRPLALDEAGQPEGRVIRLTEYIGAPRAKSSGSKCSGAR